jgi:hypothetical protein
VSDNSSLQNLNDIVLPPDVPWWPLAPGWYLLAGFIVLVIFFALYRALKQRQKNRYRMLAMQELSAIKGQGDTTDLQLIPELLKRTALSAWPRRDVAALSGTDWHRFLDRTAATDRFCSGTGEILDRFAYGGGKGASAGDDAVAAVFEASEFWLKRHKREAPEG